MVARVRGEPQPQNHLVLLTKPVTQTA